jgi:hypothetical protein
MDRWQWRKLALSLVATFLEKLLMGLGLTLGVWLAFKLLGYW